MNSSFKSFDWISSKLCILQAIFKRILDNGIAIFESASVFSEYYKGNVFNQAIFSRTFQ